MGVPWFLEVARLNPFLLEDEATLAQRVCVERRRTSIAPAEKALSMESFATTSSLIEAIASRSLAGDPPVTALYASAGADTREYTFLHPEFLSRHELSDVPAPNVFVLVDHAKQPDPEFSDPATTIETLSSEPVQASGIAMRLSRVRYTSDQFGAREIVGLTIKADNRAVQPTGTARAGYRTSSSASATAAATAGIRPKPALIDWTCRPGCRWPRRPRSRCHAGG